VGAVISYYIKEDHKSLKDIRNEKEKKLQEAGNEIPLPSYEQRRKEATEEDPFLLFVISDSEGRAIHSIKEPVKAGVHRLVWDYRTSPVGPISLESGGEYVPWESAEQGYMVPPGDYQVAMYKYQDGSLDQLGEAQSMKCNPLNIATIPTENLDALNAFNLKVATLARAISAADAHRNELKENLPYLEQAILSVGGVQQEWLNEMSAIKADLRALNEMLNGDRLLLLEEGQARMSLKSKTDLITSSLWTTTSGSTGTFERAYDDVNEGFGLALAALQKLDARIKGLENALENAGAPYTPGRIPVWEKAES
jgi:hypothetical protein